MNSFESSPNCDRASQQLFDLREGCLDAAEVTALHAHLESCPRCREDQATDDRLGTLIRGAPLHGAHGRFAIQVQRRLRQRRVWRFSLGVAAAVVLATGVIAWQNVPQTLDKSIGGNSNITQLAAGPSDVPESPVLFAAPPVDSLDLIARQQAGFVSVLQELERE